MADKKNKSHLFIIVLFLTELAVITLVVPHTWTQYIFFQDRKSANLFLGKDFESEILRGAKNWFNQLFMATGLQQASYDMMINKWNKDKQSKSRIDDRGITMFAKERLDTFWDAMGIVLYRLHETLMWVAFLGPLMFGVLVDAITQRDINKYRFSGPSPSTHYASGTSIFSMALILIIIPLAPFPMYAEIIPAAILIMSISVWIFIVNMSKHI